MNSRPATAASLSGSSTSVEEEPLLAVPVDEADETVYAAARERFQRDIGAHSSRVRACLRAIEVAQPSAQNMPLHGTNCLQVATPTFGKVCYAY